MDLWKKLRRDFGKIPWGAVASVMADEVHARSESAGDVFGHVREWATLLLGNAAVKWGKELADPGPCDCPDVTSGSPKKCGNVGMARCDVCGRRCCLAHARVDYAADAICEPCIGAAKREMRRKGGPMGDEVRKALKVLGLKDGVTYEAVKTRYRELVVKHNADRPQSEKSRLRNTERLKEVNRAFDVLRAHYDKREAA